MEEREAAFWSAIMSAVMTAISDPARAYQHRRGLRDVMLRARRVGFQPRYRRFEQAKDRGSPTRVTSQWLPRGIVIPGSPTASCGTTKSEHNARNPNRRYTAVRGGHPWFYALTPLSLVGR
jgi:hypothetical protein